MPSNSIDWSPLTSDVEALSFAPWSNWRGRMKLKADSKCRGRTKSGNPCRAAATEGGLCFFHANPKKAAELGRIGGRSKFRPSAENIEPLPNLDTACAIRDAGARLISDTFSGRLHPRVAAGLAPLLTLQLRAIQTANHEDRIGKLEKQMTKLQTNEPLPRIEGRHRGNFKRFGQGRVESAESD
jgi:hypothetical protein